LRTGTGTGLYTGMIGTVEHYNSLEAQNTFTYHLTGLTGCWVTGRWGSQKTRGGWP